MTDRHAGYLVTLSEDIREDDAQFIINALRMVQGVGAVEPIVADSTLHIATERARAEFRDKALRFVDDLFNRRPPEGT